MDNIIVHPRFLDIEESITWDLADYINNGNPIPFMRFIYFIMMVIFDRANNPEDPEQIFKDYFVFDVIKKFYKRLSSYKGIMWEEEQERGFITRCSTLEKLPEALARFLVRSEDYIEETLEYFYYTLKVVGPLIYTPEKIEEGISLYEKYLDLQPNTILHKWKPLISKGFQTEKAEREPNWVYNTICFNEFYRYNIFPFLIILHKEGKVSIEMISYVTGLGEDEIDEWFQHHNDEIEEQYLDDFKNKGARFEECLKELKNPYYIYQPKRDPKEVMILSEINDHPMPYLRDFLTSLFGSLESDSALSYFPTGKIQIQERLFITFIKDFLGHFSMDGEFIHDMNIWYEYLDSKTNYIRQEQNYIDHFNEYKILRKNLYSSHQIEIVSVWIKLFKNWGYDIFKYLDEFLKYTCDYLTIDDLRVAKKRAAGLILPNN